MKTNFCYLDNAATSFPKPQNVSKEVARCINTYCGNAGRGSHKLSLLAANKIYDCRESICNLINAPAPENIVFVPSCTFGLNLIIKGILKQGDHVLISDMEHNSVYRPIAKLHKEGKITFDIFSALSLLDKSEDKILNSIKNKLRKNTKLVICNHQSNICSYALPIEKIGAFCK
jgi:selenocysteine lyase/cysteine desulfurase